VKKAVLVFCLFALSQVAMAADNFTVWNSQTFTGPFTDNTIALSAPISNANDNSVKVYINYEEILHTGQYAHVCECNLTLIIEEEIASGVWVPVGAQGQIFRALDNSPQRMVVISPSLSWNENYSVQLPDGTDLKITQVQANAPTSFRVRVAVDEFIEGTVTSAKLSVYGRMYTD